MEVKMNSIQGKLLLEESLYLVDEFHKSGFNEGCGRAFGSSYEGWYNVGNGGDLQFYFEKYVKYDFNAIWKTMK